MINTNSIEEAKRLIKKEKTPIIVRAINDDFNRKIIEYGKIDIILSIEAGTRKRGIRQVDSGLNAYLAKTAKKNKIAIGIDLEEIRKLTKEEKSIRLEKIVQNIKICRKTNTRILLMNYKDKIDAFNLLISLGASTKQAKEAISF